MLPRIAVAAALFGLAAPLAAQDTAQTGTPASSPSSPSVVSANTEAARRVEARQAGHDAINADLQAQYEDDMAGYRQQVEARQDAIASDQARYDHQQRAYADAMRAWRAQVAACKHGNSKACRAPTPSYTDFQ